MTPGPSDGDLSGRRPGMRSGAAGEQRAVAERSAARTARRIAGAVTGVAGVRVPAVAVAFIICGACLLADERSAIQLSAPAARPVDASLGLWTATRLRVARISLRRFRTRLAYGANTCATRQTGRYNYKPADTLAGDIELNPGPDGNPSAAPPGTLTAYHVNARS